MSSPRLYFDTALLQPGMQAFLSKLFQCQTCLQGAKQMCHLLGLNFPSGAVFCPNESARTEL